jgi:hypothetical protein
MDKSDIDVLDIVFITPVTLLFKRQVLNYLKVYQIVHFELLFYSRCLIFAKLFVYNPVSNINFGKIFFSNELYLPVGYYANVEQYLKLLQKNLYNMLPDLNTKEFEMKTNSMLKEYVLNELRKDKYSLVESIDKLLNKL